MATYQDPHDRNTSNPNRPRSRNPPQRPTRRYNEDLRNIRISVPVFEIPSSDEDTVEYDPTTNALVTLNPLQNLPSPVNSAAVVTANDWPEDTALQEATQQSMEVNYAVAPRNPNLDELIHEYSWEHKLDPKRIAFANYFRTGYVLDYTLPIQMRAPENQNDADYPIIPPELWDKLQDFACTQCGGIVCDPVKCKHCKHYCRPCLKQLIDRGFICDNKKQEKLVHELTTREDSFMTNISNTVRLTCEYGCKNAIGKPKIFDYGPGDRHHRGNECRNRVCQRGCGLFRSSHDDAHKNRSECDKAKTKFKAWLLATREVQKSKIQKIIGENTKAKTDVEKLNQEINKLRAVIDNSNARELKREQEMASSVTTGFQQTQQLLQQVNLVILDLNHN